MTPKQATTSLESGIKSEALRLGFSLCGIAPAAGADGFSRYQHWLDLGYAGEMTYLHRHAEKKRHPASILANVKSIVMLGMEYRAEQNHRPNIERAPPQGRIASYAAGPDYHQVIWERLNTLCDWLMEMQPGSSAVGVTDTAPLLERDFARRAGLGWAGKNTMLINPKRGSFFFLAGLLTDIELQADSPFEKTHCGTCTACLDACPTQAFAQPFVLDASKCISYLTIELRSEIPEGLREPIGDWLFGCDICQDVCPWNRKPSPGPVGFPVNPDMEWLDPVELLGLDADAFRARFKKTALFRTRRAGLLRNAAIVLGNTGDQRSLPALERALSDAEELVRSAAAWAIERIRKRERCGVAELPDTSSG